MGWSSWNQHYKITTYNAHDVCEHWDNIIVIEKKNIPFVMHKADKSTLSPTFEMRMSKTMLTKIEQA